jgi:NAD(P)-dependent dehydrogenase (short-subunit alcohol dehydrogenase family)
MGLLEGKVAIITGAGRGVGRAVAAAFAREGALVSLAARSVDEIESATEEIRSTGGKAIAIPADVIQQEQVEALFRQTTQKFGSVDILVNNAAIIGSTGMLWELELGVWQEIFEANILSMICCCRVAIPHMIEKRYGKIINVGSDAGYSEGWAVQFPEQAAYGTSKAAVKRFSELLANQVKRYGINVNCLGVSAHTRMGYEANVALARARGTAPPAPLDSLPPEKQILPDENAGAFLFLASPLSDHITGAYFEANRLPNIARALK